jgi:hypothetical protein
MVEDIEIRDEEEDFKQGGYSINEIILRHIRKLSDICCKEFTGGYWKKTPIKTAQGIMFIEDYKEDIRECFCNNVKFLIWVVTPRSDENFKKFVKENYKNESDIKKKMEIMQNIFEEMNFMFERTNFWQTGGISYE